MATTLGGREDREIDLNGEGTKERQGARDRISDNFPRN
tara:strand:+ start:78 stop:191 length:114 start_codon:yes stop_codon:yes gene_type:complete